MSYMLPCSSVKFYPHTHKEVINMSALNKPVCCVEAAAAGKCERPFNMVKG